MYQKTARHTDLMQPEYHINGVSVNDDPRYSRPKPLKNQIVDSCLLRTDDIAGAQAGYVAEHLTAIPNSKRTEFRNTNYLGDIKGAQADSVKHSIVTQRLTNPLQPVYQALDPGEVIYGPIKPLIPSELVDPKKNFKIHGNITATEPSRSHVNITTTNTISNVTLGSARTPTNGATSTFFQNDNEFHDFGIGGHSSQYLEVNEDFSNTAKPPLIAQYREATSNPSKNTNLQLTLPKGNQSNDKLISSSRQNNTSNHNSARSFGSARSSGRNGMSNVERRVVQETRNEIDMVRSLM